MHRYRLAALAVLLAVTAAPAQEWTRFHGPNGSGYIADAKLPAAWTAKDYNWKVAVPGVGHSSPVLWGDRIFLTSGDPKKGTRLALCLHADDGRTLWTKEWPAAAYKKHKSNSFATSTPAVDAGRLYVTWGSPEDHTVAALDHDGNVVWEKDLGPFHSQHGFGPSPIVYGDLLIVPADQDKGGYVIALDRKTGATAWKLDRRSGNATFSTPCVYEPEGGPAQLILTNWKHGMTSVDPKTGKVNWEVSVFEPGKAERAIASPVVAGDLILGTCGFVTAQKHFVAVRPGAANAAEVWRTEKSVSYLPTPVVSGDRIYLCTEKGLARCLKASTGEQLWEERVGEKFYSSPVGAGDKIFCVSTDGEVIVLAASDTFQFLGRSDLGEGTQSTPAVAGGRIYFRTDGHLISVGGGER